VSAQGAADDASGNPRPAFRLFGESSVDAMSDRRRMRRDAQRKEKAAALQRTRP
jgi:hypothetical protein